MPHHVVVDGSNLATEGRALPSLQQLNDAVLAFIAENPDALITVVVDATFGHRIDSHEVKEFDEAVANNELVAPPAGAVGRGDAFVLSIANKVRATILSNDSFQEFHGQYPWLFDEGRLIGGKPVPHIGWVFVPRVPVRGPISRSSVKQARRKADGTPVSESERGSKRRTSPEASQPMPVPKAPPPNATLAKTGGKGTERRQAAKAAPTNDQAHQAATPAPKAAAVNDLMPFLDFVQHHPVGTSVNAVVDSYSSHGAYVRIGEAHGYVPLRLMADPAPRSAREFMKIGDAVTLVVSSFAAARRSIELAAVGMAPPAPEPASAKAPRKRATKSAAALSEAVVAPATAPATPAPAKKSRAKKASTQPVVAIEAVGAAAVIADTLAAEAVAQAEASQPKRTAAKKSPTRKPKAAESKPGVQKPAAQQPIAQKPVEQEPVERRPAAKHAAAKSVQPKSAEPTSLAPKAATKKAPAKKAATAQVTPPEATPAPPSKPAAKRTRKSPAPDAPVEPTRTTPGGRSRRTR